MNCYHCESSDLALAPLWPRERVTYAAIGIVLRLCLYCGMEQSHCGDDESLAPTVAALEAPDQPILGKG